MNTTGHRPPLHVVQTSAEQQPDHAAELRRYQAIEAARQAGYDDGFGAGSRLAYVDGWRWGALCGAVGATLVAAIGVALFVGRLL